MKGSRVYNEYDSDVYYAQPVYENNFVYLFGLERMNVDAALNLKSKKSFVIVRDRSNDYYI